jgi:hypothetical protein
MLAADVYPAPISTTDPVGVPVPPLTVTLTVRACVVLMLTADGVAVTVGVVFVAEVTASIAAPLAPL